jgi:predicted nucleic acid-binding protein
MTDVFVDTNVLLDVLAKRHPFHGEALEIWTLCEEGTLHGFISVISFNNIFYLVRKFGNAAEAYAMLETLRKVFTPVTLDAQLIHQALGAGISDFEDAIQFHSALRANAQCLITRNAGHFPKSNLLILSPSEFLAARAAT